VRRAWRLRANQDFLRVRREGRSWAHPLLVLVARRGSDPEALTRVGITVSRRVGNAVVRNRTKRRVRETLRSRYSCLARGWDLVLVVRPKAAESNFAAIGEATDSLLGRAQLMTREMPCGESRS
jgi:ribonuclease P protein component